MLTELDHGSNIAPWTAIALERGITIRTVKMRPDGQLDWEDFEAALTPRVKLVAIHNASNVLGTITDVTRATRMAHAVGAQVFVDCAVHSAPHELVDVQAIDCDFLACSAYKFYGPHVGILWGRREMIELINPPQLVTASRNSPERMQTGTQGHESIMGAAAAVNFLATLGRGGETRRPGYRIRVRDTERTQRSAIRRLVERPLVRSRRYAVWSASGFASHANRFVHGRWPPHRDRRRRACRAGVVPLARAISRADGREGASRHTMVSYAQDALAIHLGRKSAGWSTPRQERGGGQLV